MLDNKLVKLVPIRDEQDIWDADFVVKVTKDRHGASEKQFRVVDLAKVVEPDDLNRAKQLVAQLDDRVLALKQNVQLVAIRVLSNNLSGEARAVFLTQVVEQVHLVTQQLQEVTDRLCSLDHLYRYSE